MHASTAQQSAVDAARQSNNSWQQQSEVSENATRKDINEHAEEASFIDTFASLEDLLRFQSPRFAALLSVFKAELVLSRKAFFVSVALTVLSALVVFTMWGLANALMVALILRQGVSVTVALLIIFSVNAVLLLFALTQLKSAVYQIGLNRSLEAVKVQQSDTAHKATES